RQKTACPRPVSRRRGSSLRRARKSSHFIPHRSFPLQSRIDAKIGWIGTGRMGFVMAQRLARAGCDLTVWNRTRAKAEPLARDGARIANYMADLGGWGVWCL